MASLKSHHNRAMRNVSAAVDHLAECGSGTLPMGFDDLNDLLGAIEILSFALAKIRDIPMDMGEAQKVAREALSTFT